MDFTFKKKVTKGSCTGYVKKVPHCYKVPYERDKSSLSMLQKFPINVTKVPHVTEVPFFRDKSAGSYGSLSPFIHFMVINSNFLTINKTKGSIGPMLKHLHLSSIELKLTVGDCQPSK